MNILLKGNRTKSTCSRSNLKNSTDYDYNNNYFYLRDRTDLRFPYISLRYFSNIKDQNSSFRFGYLNQKELHRCIMGKLDV